MSKYKPEPEAHEIVTKISGQLPDLKVEQIPFENYCTAYTGFEDVLLLARSLDTRAIDDGYRLDIIRGRLEEYAKELGL